MADYVANPVDLTKFGGSLPPIRDKAAIVTHSRRDRLRFWRKILSEDAMNVVLSMTNPTDKEMTAIAAFVDGMVAAGLWSQMDSFQCAKMDSSTNALVDWVADVSPSVVNTPTFQTDNLGYLFDASIDSIETDIQPDAGANETDADGMMFLRGRNMSASDGSNHVYCGVGHTTSGRHSRMFGLAAGNVFQNTIHQTGATSTTFTKAEAGNTVIAWILDTALTGTEHRTYKSGVLDVSSSLASQTRPDQKAVINGWRSSGGGISNAQAGWYYEVWGTCRASGMDQVIFNTLVNNLCATLDPDHIGFQDWSDTSSHPGKVARAALKSTDADEDGISTGSNLGTQDITSEGMDSNGDKGIAFDTTSEEAALLLRGSVSFHVSSGLTADGTGTGSHTQLIGSSNQYIQWRSDEALRFFWGAGATMDMYIRSPGKDNGYDILMSWDTNFVEFVVDGLPMQRFPRTGAETGFDNWVFGGLTSANSDFNGERVSNFILEDVEKIMQPSGKNILFLGDSITQQGGMPTWINTPAPSTSKSGVHSGANNAAVLTDGDESWTTNQWVGFTLTNTVTGSTGPITENDGTTVTATLADGSPDDLWHDTAGGNAYTIQTAAVKPLWATTSGDTSTTGNGFQSGDTDTTSVHGNISTAMGDSGQILNIMRVLSKAGIFTEGNYNFSRAGAGTGDMETYVDTYVPTTRPISVAAIMLGTNDANNNVAAATYEPQYKALLTALDARGDVAAVEMCLIPSISNDSSRNTSTYRDKVEEINTFIQTLPAWAVAQGYWTADEIIISGLFALLGGHPAPNGTLDPDDFVADDLHPTNPGQYKIGVERGKNLAALLG